MSVRRGDPCTIEGCDKPVVGRGWCSKHYAVSRKFGDPLHPTRRYERQSDSCSHEGCVRKPKRRGLCEMHAKRDEKHGETTDPRKRNFWLQVNKDGPIPPDRPDLGPCWVWTAHVNKGVGYGQFSPKHGVQVGAHRFAYELTNGPIADGYEVHHRCHTRRCVRPEHLAAATRSENMAERKVRR